MDRIKHHRVPQRKHTARCAMLCDTRRFEGRQVNDLPCQLRGGGVMVVVLLALTLSGCAGGPSVNGQTSGAAKAKDLRINKNLEDLRSRLFSFADRYLSRVGEVGDEVIASTASLEARLEVQEKRYLNSFAVVELAGGSNPAATLLDLMVLTRLQVRVLERGDLKSLIGPASYKKLHYALSGLAEDMWTIGRDYLNASQIANVNRLIDQWLEANPERSRVASVRFDDFTSMRGGQALRANLKGSGLFSSIDQAAATANTATKLAARSKFVAERLPLLLSWRVEMLVADLMLMPEVRGALGSINALTASIDRLAETISSLPARLAEQAGKVSKVLGQTRETIQRVEGMIEPATQMADEYQAAAKAITEAVEAGDRLYQSLYTSGEKKNPNAEPFDITDYTTAATQLTRAARQVDDVLHSTHDLLNSEALDQTVTEVKTAADQRINHAGRTGQSVVRSAFWYGLILIGVACVLALGTALLYRWLSERVWGRPSSNPENR